MNMLTNIILLVQILSALAMIGLILIQHGKGADMGAAFGSGSSGSLFGASSKLPLSNHGRVGRGVLCRHLGLGLFGQCPSGGFVNRQRARARHGHHAGHA